MDRKEQLEDLNKFSDWYVNKLYKLAIEISVFKLKKKLNAFNFSMNDPNTK